MAFKPNPPKKWVFFVALFLGLLSVGMYFFGALAVEPGAYLPVTFYAFWIMAVAWLLLIAGAVLEDL
jgi:hypothetical protein